MFTGIDSYGRISPEGYNAFFKRRTWFSIVSLVTITTCAYGYMTLKAPDWMLDLFAIPVVAVTLYSRLTSYPVQIARLRDIGKRPAILLPNHLMGLVFIGLILFAVYWARKTHAGWGDLYGWLILSAFITIPFSAYIRYQRRLMQRPGLTSGQMAAIAVTGHPIARHMSFNGRLSRKGYASISFGNRFGTYGLFLLAAFICGAATRLYPLALWAILGLVILVLVYMQYRYAQLTVQRMHDRNMNGIWVMPMLIARLLIFSIFIGEFLAISAKKSNFISNYLDSIGPIQSSYRIVIFIGIALLILYYAVIKINLDFFGSAPFASRFGSAPVD